jgi:hypothetical protein
LAGLCSSEEGAASCAEPPPPALRQCQAWRPCKNRAQQAVSITSQLPRDSERAHQPMTAGTLAYSHLSRHATAVTPSQGMAVTGGAITQSHGALLRPSHQPLKTHHHERPCADVIVPAMGSAIVPARDCTLAPAQLALARGSACTSVIVNMHHLFRAIIAAWSDWLCYTGNAVYTKAGPACWGVVLSQHSTRRHKRI